MRYCQVAYMIIICTILSFVVSCKKQPVCEKTKTDWDLYELQNKVAVINEQTYNMMTDEVTQRKLCFDTLGMLTNRSFYEHNKLVRQIIYTDSMRVQLDAGNRIEWITLVQRDTNGLILEEYTESEMGEWTTTYNYNSNGLMTLETTLNVDGEFMSATHYSYNDDSRLEQQLEVGADGQVGSMTKYTYSADGLLTKVEQVDGEGLLVQYQLYSYNSQGLQTEEKYINASGVVFYSCQTKYEDNLPVERKYKGTNIYDQTYTYTYSDGHKTSETIIESDNREGRDVVIIKTERECDDYGNWVQEKIFNADKNELLIPVSITNRIIEYYE